MVIAKKDKGNRGLTLVMALFVTFLLSTLSLAFVALMMEDSRGSQSSVRQIMAAEGAEWGIETALSYMGRGGNWQAAFDADRLVFFDLLHAGQPNGPHHLQASAGEGGAIQVLVEAGSGEESALRVLRLVDPNLPLGAVLNLDDRLVGRITVEVKPVVTPLAAYGPGQAAQYTLTSRCELFMTEDAGSGAEPVAIAQLEAQVRPEVETTALFQVQNMRSWDVQGGGVGNPSTADKIIIPADYVSAGSVNVTGTDPKNPNAPWSQQAGNLRFQNPDAEDMVFQGQLSVNQLSNLDLSGNTVSEGDPKNFPGGVVFGADYLPLPSSKKYLNHDRNGDGQVGTGAPPGPGDLGGADQEWGLLAVAARDKNGPNTPHGPTVSGYYHVGKELVSEAHKLNPKVPNPASSVPLAQQDFRPAIPEVEVRLKSGGFIEVNVWETNAGDGGFTSSLGNLNTIARQQLGADGGPLGQTFHVDQLKNGVLYIEGGQVIVHSELSSGETAEFEGRLQIIAAEDALRRGEVKTGSSPQTYANPATALYHPAVGDYLNWQESRTQLAPDDPDYVSPAEFRAPPYTAAELREAAQSGAISSSVADLSGVDDASLFWKTPLSSVESEGNLVVAGDIVKKDNTNSLIGLTAENFVFLNDRTLGQKQVANELVVEAVLTSFEHSLQFDWDNTSKNKVVGSSGGTSYTQAMTPGFNGKLTLQGSMLAPFSDVEGDLQGRGYPRQEFRHDDELARHSPPFQPRTLLSEYPNDQISIAWTIISYKDRTSKGVHLD